VNGRVLVLAVPLLLAGVACVNRDPGPYRAAVPPLPASLDGAPAAERGKVLYLRDCAWCHGASAEGTPTAPDLVSGTRGGAAVDFVLRTRRMPLRRPDDPMRRGAATTEYSAADRLAIVEYLSGFDPAGPPIPAREGDPLAGRATGPGEPAPAPLSKGAELYFANCAACHSSTGIGGTLSAAQRGDAPPNAPPETFAPPVTDSSAIEAVEAMRVGPGTMPVFGPKTLTDDEVDAIAAYVEYLGRPADPGGIASGHIGPVSEGAVGWLIGLGLLLGVARWIGSRTGDEGEAVGSAAERPGEPA
jgi:ubiquinol-cytochrome c reductase cytochrome c subunit